MAIFIYLNFKYSILFLLILSTPVEIIFPLIPVHFPSKIFKRGFDSLKCCWKLKRLGKIKIKSFIVILAFSSFVYVIIRSSAVSHVIEERKSTRCNFFFFWRRLFYHSCSSPSFLPSIYNINIILYYICTVYIYMYRIYIYLYRIYTGTYTCI